MGAFDDTVAAAKAIADPTRLRIIAALRRHELTVTELCAVLDQSQPRVSRHLKLLVDGGLLTRQPQGAQAFYRRGDGELAMTLARAVDELVDPEDPVLARDGHRLQAIRRSREALANEYFERVAGEWDGLRGRLVEDALVEQALLDAVPSEPGLRLLDLGTGTGRVLELLAGRVESGVGIDLSREMLHLARTRLERNGRRHLRVRHGSITDLDVPAASADVVVIHHVLHHLDDPSLALEQAAWATRIDGTLLVVDFAPHDLERLRSEHAHRRLGIGVAEMDRWCSDAGFDVESVVHLTPEGPEADEALTVTLWRARRTDRPSTIRPLPEMAS
jgi:ubiquinone/menaquinone biosynthesis C-methylase UbiE